MSLRAAESSATRRRLAQAGRNNNDDSSTEGDESQNDDDEDQDEILNESQLRELPKIHSLVQVYPAAGAIDTDDNADDDDDDDDDDVVLHLERGENWLRVVKQNHERDDDDGDAEEVLFPSLLRFKSMGEIDAPSADIFLSLDVTPDNKMIVKDWRAPHSDNVDDEETPRDDHETAIRVWTASHKVQHWMHQRQPLPRRIAVILTPGDWLCIGKDPGKDLSLVWKYTAETSIEMTEGDSQLYDYSQTQTSTQAEMMTQDTVINMFRSRPRDLGVSAKPRQDFASINEEEGLGDGDAAVLQKNSLNGGYLTQPPCTPPASAVVNADPAHCPSDLEKTARKDNRRGNDSTHATQRNVSWLTQKPSPLPPTVAATEDATKMAENAEGSNDEASTRLRNVSLFTRAQSPSLEAGATENVASTLEKQTTEAAIGVHGNESSSARRRETSWLTQHPSSSQQVGATPEVATTMEPTTAGNCNEPLDRLRKSSMLTHPPTPHHQSNGSDVVVTALEVEGAERTIVNDNESSDRVRKSSTPPVEHDSQLSKRRRIQEMTAFALSEHSATGTEAVIHPVVPIDEEEEQKTLRNSPSGDDVVIPDGPAEAASVEMATEDRHSEARATSNRVNVAEGITQETSAVDSDDDTVDPEQDDSTSKLMMALPEEKMAPSRAVPGNESLSDRVQKNSREVEHDIQLSKRRRIQEKTSFSLPSPSATGAEPVSHRKKSVDDEEEKEKPAVDNGPRGDDVVMCVGPAPATSDDSTGALVIGRSEDKTEPELMEDRIEDAAGTESASLNAETQAATSQLPKTPSRPSAHGSNTTPMSCKTNNSERSVSLLSPANMETATELQQEENQAKQLSESPPQVEGAPAGTSASAEVEQKEQPIPAYAGAEVDLEPFAVELTAKNGRLKGTSWRLEQNDKFCIGSKPLKPGYKPLVITGEPSVDENHALVEFSSESHFMFQKHMYPRLQVRDLGSKEGTYVGNVRLFGSTALFVGGSLRIGNVSFEVSRALDASSSVAAIEQDVSAVVEGNPIPVSDTAAENGDSASVSVPTKDDPPSQPSATKPTGAHETGGAATKGGPDKAESEPQERSATKNAPPMRPERNPGSSRTTRQAQARKTLPEVHVAAPRDTTPTSHLTPNEAEASSTTRSTRKRKAPRKPIETPRSTRTSRRAGKPATRATPGAVLFSESRSVAILVSGIEVDKEIKDCAQKIGASIIDDVTQAHSATHIILHKTMKFTAKVLIAICKTKNVVSLDWLRKCGAENQVVSCDDFFLLEKSVIDNIDSNLFLGCGILDGWKVFVSKGVAGKKCPNENELKLIVEAAGGTWLDKLPKNKAATNVLCITSDRPTKAQQRDVEGRQNKTMKWFLETVKSQKRFLE